ncbi:hypothetical protein QTP88_028176 [Uroleucon formosanum]
MEMFQNTCSASLLTKIDKTFHSSNGEHVNHASNNNEKIERQILRENCKRKVEESTSIRPLKNIRTELLNSDLPNIMNNDITSVRKAIYDKKRKQYPIYPTSLNEATSQLKYMQNNDLSNFESLEVGITNPEISKISAQQSNNINENDKIDSENEDVEVSHTNDKQFGFASRMVQTMSSYGLMASFPNLYLAFKAMYTIPASSAFANEYFLRLCQQIWMEERVPDSWNEAIIIPLYKKGDKTKCDNYRGLSLLNSAYKVFSRILLNRMVPYVEDCLGEYQCGFRKRRSTTEKLSVIGQIIEKGYKYRQNMWQLFIDFKKAYDSIHRESLYNIMYEFGFPKKLIALTKMCMENTKYRVRTRNITSETFTVETGLKQGDALSLVLFNLTLEKVIRVLQDNEGGLLIGQNKIQILGFADDLDILGDSLSDTANAARVLEEVAKRKGLEINTEKTKIMELIESGEDPSESENLAYEKVSDLKYLGATLVQRMIGKNNKNRLRTTIGQNRLESLMLLSCEKDISPNLEEALDRMGKSSQLLERAFLFK